MIRGIGIACGYDMDTNVINLFKSTPAANDSGFLERVYPAVLHPANQITIEQKLLSISVSDLSKGLVQAEAARVQRKEIGRPTWQVMGNRLRAHIVPLLGDVPYLGNLFKTRTKSSTKTEMLIFLTPKVVTDRTAAR